VEQGGKDNYMSKTLTEIQYWRTRDGRKAVVFPEFSTSKTTKGFIIGDSNHFWFPHIWERQSECSKEVFSTDLISPWTDELDFDASCLPKWANKWIAMDRDGEWRCYKDKPWSQESYWRTCSNYPIPDDFEPKNFQKEWVDSLHQIVDGKAVKV